MRWKTIHDFPEPALERPWRASLKEADFPAHYVAPEFFREPFWTGRSPFAVLALEGNDIVGVVTGIREGSHLIAGLPVRPQVCCRIAADRRAVAGTLAEGLRAQARGKAGLVSIYSWAEMDGFRGAGFRGQSYAGEQGVVMLDLTRGPEALFRDFSENRRTNIRKAMKSGLEVSQTTDAEDLRAFYAIYSGWCARKHIETQPFPVMEAAFRLTGNRRLFVARHRGQIIAAVTLRLEPGGILEYAANCSLEPYQRLKPNDLLHWRIIEWGAREGCRLYSLGGAHLFLRKFGGTLVQTFGYRLDLTFGQRHHLQEVAASWGRRMFDALPEGARGAVRRALGRGAEIPA
jgi:hypothetical protein